MAGSFAIAFLLLVAPTPTLEESLALRRIAAFWEEGEYKIARHEIESFLAAHPGSEYSDELRVGLGDLLFREKQYAEALAAYAGIEKADMAEQVFAARLRCLYELQWYATLADLCEGRLKASPDTETAAFFLDALEQMVLSNPETAAKQLARARPYAEQGTAAYAHLLSMAGSHAEAEALFLKLALVEGNAPEEMRFLAALEQRYTDPAKAIASFREVEARGGERADDAREQRVALLLKQGQFEAILLERDQLMHSKRLQLYLVRAEIALGRPERAIALLMDGDLDRDALLHLAEVATLAHDRAAMEKAVAELKGRFPEEAQLPQVELARVHLLREAGDLDAALAAWESLENPGAEAQLERLAIDYARGDWIGCCDRAEPLLDNSAEAWRFRIAAMSRLENPPELLRDLERMPLGLFAADEQANWTLLRAKTLYDLGRIEPALTLLAPLDHPNALLLRALCAPELAEELLPQALAGGADLLPEEEIHLLLYNALLHRGQAAEAAEHLFAASEQQSISPENLLWLARFYAPRDPERASLLYGKVCVEPKLEMAALEWADLLEGAAQRSWLEQLASLTAEDPLLKDEVDVRLADVALQEGRRNEAIARYRSVVARHPPLESAPSARASVSLAELLREEGSFEEALSLLKAASLQMNFAHEPYHLQATVAYANLQAELAPASERWQKRLTLLESGLKHYTQPVSLIERDYQESRAHYPDKEPHYAAWIARMEAEIAACRSALQEQDEPPQARTR